MDKNCYFLSKLKKLCTYCLLISKRQYNCQTLVFKLKINQNMKYSFDTSCLNYKLNDDLGF